MSGTADTAAACWHPSPNFGPRRDGLTPSLIVIHYTAMHSASAALQRLCDPSVEVSAHYLIGAEGHCWQMVAEDQRAWHAGAGQWCGFDDINSRSIGIELDNRGDHPFAEPQMVTLERLMKDIMSRWSISAQGVIGHSDMAPGRKIDPGPRFDWPRLACQGLADLRSCDEGPMDPTFELFRRMAHRVGFTSPVEDEALLSAVRLRYRPWARGSLAADDFIPLGPSSSRS
nr:N-acetylmuramoyl-L-alanine amidase [Parasedimentitalea marina]